MYILYFLVGCQSQVLCAVQGSLGAVQSWLLTQSDSTDKSSVTWSSTSLQGAAMYSVAHAPTEVAVI